jgi:hypothetical protein
MLADEAASSPISTVWIPAKVARKHNLSLADARETVIAAAKRILSDEELRVAELSDVDEEVMILLPITPKQELLAMLADSDGQRFVDCLVSHFRSLTRFVPVLNEIFKTPMTG